MYNVTYTHSAHGASTMVSIFHIYFSLISHVSLKFRARAQSSQRFINVFFVNHGLVWLEHFTRIVQTKAQPIFVFVFALRSSPSSSRLNSLSTLSVWILYIVVFLFIEVYILNQHLFSTHIYGIPYTCHVSVRVVYRNFRCIEMDLSAIELILPINWLMEIERHGINKHRPWERRRSMLCLKKNSFV